MMARASRANGLRGTVWACQTTTFAEGEGREWAASRPTSHSPRAQRP
jgi:hypothetical protein